MTEWVRGHDGITPDTIQDLNVAELTRELAQVVKGSNRTLRRDLDAAIERFALNLQDEQGQPVYAEAHISMNGKGR